MGTDRQVASLGIGKEKGRPVLQKRHPRNDFREKTAAAVLGQKQFGNYCTITGALKAFPIAAQGPLYGTPDRYSLSLKSDTGYDLVR